MAERAFLTAMLLVLTLQYLLVVVLYVDAKRHGVERVEVYAWAASYLPLVGLPVLVGYFYERSRILENATTADSDEE